MTRENQKKKDWLSRAKRIDEEIKTLTEEKARLFDSATKTTAGYSEGGVQATVNPHKFEKYAEYSALLDERLAKLYQTKTEVMAAISTLKDTVQRNILIQRYIVGASWEEIENSTDYSRKQIDRKHGEALTKLDYSIMTQRDTK